jgi:hypothetical protein
MAALLQCGLLNPLDYLQSGRPDDAGPESSPGDVDAEVLPGCPREKWADCGATIVRSGTTPTVVGADSLTGSGSDRRVFFGEAETGTLFELSCAGETCDPPVPIVSGEGEPLTIAYGGGSLFWATASEVRRATLGPDGAVAETIDTTSGPTALSAAYPYAAWSDANGVRAFHFVGAVSPSLFTGASSSVLLSRTALFFVAGGEVHTCALTDSPPRCTPTRVSGVSGGDLLANAEGFAKAIFLGGGGIIASVPRPTGTQLLLIEQPDDAGALPTIETERSDLRALDAFDRDIYFTTSRGELLRRTRDLAKVEVILRGLGARTSIAAAGGQIFIADRDQKQLVRVVR